MSGTPGASPAAFIYHLLTHGDVRPARLQVARRRAAASLTVGVAEGEVRAYLV